MCVFYVFFVLFCLFVCLLLFNFNFIVVAFQFTLDEEECI